MRESSLHEYSGSTSQLFAQCSMEIAQEGECEAIFGLIDTKNTVVQCTMEETACY